MRGVRASEGDVEKRSTKKEEKDKGTKIAEKKKRRKGEKERRRKGEKEKNWTEFRGGSLLPHRYVFSHD